MKKIASGLGIGIDKATNGLSLLGGLFITISAFIITIGVLMRVFLKYTFLWVSELSVLLVLMSVFLTLAYGLKMNSHVNVEAVTDKLSVSARNSLKIVSLVITLVLGILFARYYFISSASSFRLNDSTELADIPIGPCILVVAVACIVLALQAVRMIFGKSYSLKKQDPESGKTQISIPMLAVFLLLFFAILFILFKVNITAGVILMLVFLLVMGIPVSFSMCSAAIVGMLALVKPAVAIASIPKLCYTSWEGFTVTALPLFVFLGVVLYKSGMADELFECCRLWVGHLPGGLAIATVTACAIFAAISGSSVANAMTIGMVAIPAMISYKYDEKLAAGLVAAGGTLGILIPPSSPMVMIGVITGESISDLFISGLLPGLVLWFLYCAAAVIICLKKKGAYERLPRATMKERLKGTKDAAGVLALPIIILGGIYSGLCTPTEAAAISVFYVVLYSLIVKKVGLKKFLDIVMESTTSVAMVGILTAGGIALTKVITMLQVTQKAVAWLAASGLPGWTVVVAAIILLVILGMFLEGSAIVMLTTPIMFPMVTSYGYSVCWFAVIVVICIEIGLLTPPVGLNLFVIRQVSGVEVLKVFRGSLPFFILMFVGVALVFLIPQLATWLPSIF